MQTGDFDPSLASQAGQPATDAITAAANMRDAQRWLIIAAMLNSALFLTASLVLGFVLHNNVAWMSAFIGFGTCYLSPMVQLMFPQERVVALVLVVASLFFGVLSGGALLFGG